MGNRTLGSSTEPNDKLHIPILEMGKLRLRGLFLCAHETHWLQTQGERGCRGRLSPPLVPSRACWGPELLPGLLGRNPRAKSPRASALPRSLSPGHRERAKELLWRPCRTQGVSVPAGSAW